MPTPPDALISDAELLNLGVATDALNGIAVSVRDDARGAATDVAMSYIRKQYTPPITTTDMSVKRAVAHIAAYDLLCTRGFSPLAGSDDAIEKRHDKALGWLLKLSKGHVEANITDSTGATHENAPLVSVATDTPLWGDYGSD